MTNSNDISQAHDEQVAQCAHAGAAERALKAVPFYKRPPYWFASSYSFCYYACAAFVFSFYAIWLSNEIGLTAAQTGILYSFNFSVSLFIMSFYGIVQDKLVLRKHLVWFQSIIMTASAPALIYVYEPLLRSNFYAGVIFGSLYLGFGWVAGMGLIDSFCEKISRACSIEFGQVRTWGCLAYAAGTFVAGLLMSVDPHLNFYMASAVGVLYMILNVCFKPHSLSKESLERISNTKSNLTFAEIVSVFKLKRFWIFVIYVLGTYSLYNIFDQQLFPVFFTHLFDEKSNAYQIYGYLNSAQVFLEAMVMFCVPFVANKIGAKNALLFAALVSGLRIYLASVVSSIELFALIKLMHCLEISTVLVAVFKYIQVNFDKRISATVFLIGYQVAGSVGVILFSSTVGSFYDQIGPEQTFHYLGLTVFAFMIFALFFLRQDKSIKALFKSKKQESNDHHVVEHSASQA